MESNADMNESSGAASREMPRYKCHKEVWALKIMRIEQAPADQERMHAGGDWLLFPDEDGYAPINVGHDEYYTKHKPQPGGYYVVYDDGYKSYSPAAPFEAGYAPLKDTRAAIQEQIAKVAHEVNRAYCAALGDTSQPAWEDAPQWQKDSALVGVRMHLANPDATPEQSHESWLAQRQADGWKYGPVKDAEKEEHPCFVPYAELPESQRAKDYLFRGVVHAMRQA